MNHIVSLDCFDWFQTRHLGHFGESVRVRDQCGVWDEAALHFFTVCPMGRVRRITGTFASRVACGAGCGVGCGGGTDGGDGCNGPEHGDEHRECELEGELGGGSRI